MNDTKAAAGFVPGDVVCLKSGGPEMTVLRVIGPLVEVGWFTGTDFVDDDIQMRMLDAACVELVDGEFGGTDDDGERTVATGEVIKFDLRGANGESHAIAREVAAA